MAGRFPDTFIWRKAKANLDPAIPWGNLEKAHILVTGSTGLIGSQLVRTLLCANDELGLDCKLVLPVRNALKAEALFGAQPEIACAPWSLGEPLECNGAIDYICHAASNTASRDFLEKPASILEGTFAGGRAVLGLARAKQVRKAVLLSTMEVYGEVSGKVAEEDLGKLDPAVVRNSYPVAKKALEALFCAYAAEYGCSTSVVRLAQTFGEGVAFGDARVFADFGRCVYEGRDIVMLSEGSKQNPYLALDDAVRAILFIMLRGEAGGVYNAANEETYCSIYEMAQELCSAYGQAGTQVVRQVDPERERTFRKASDLNLDCSKLMALGWEPRESLMEMYEGMFASWREGE